MATSQPGDDGSHTTQGNPESHPAGTTAQQAARRTKAMSIGNAAALFGAPDEVESPEPSESESITAASGEGLFARRTTKSPIAVKTPFTAVQEDAETEEAAGLFGEDGSASMGSQVAPAASGHMGWLGGNSGVNISNHEQYKTAGGIEQEREGLPWEQQPNGLAEQASAPYQDSLYRQQDLHAGQQEQSYGTNTASMHYYGQGSHSGMAEPQMQHTNYGTYEQSQIYSNQAVYDAQQSQDTQGYYNGAYMAPPAPQYVDAYGAQDYDFSQGQYSQLQSHSQQQQYSNSQQFPTYSEQNATASVNGYSYPAQSSHGQADFRTAATFTPFSAPAAAGYTNEMARSQSTGPIQTGTSNYTEAYDPYAPDSNQASRDLPPTQTTFSGGGAAAGSQSSFTHGQGLHPSLQPPGLPRSSTTASVLHGAPMSKSTGSSNTASGSASAPKLNRSASSFFAELPPMPAPKSRPPSALSGIRHAAPPLPSFTQQSQPQAALPPPPPKSRTPAPQYPVRPTSASNAGDRLGSQLYGSRHPISNATSGPAIHAGQAEVVQDLTRYRNGRQSADSAYSGRSRQEVSLPLPHRPIGEQVAGSHQDFHHPEVINPKPIHREEAASLRRMTGDTFQQTYPEPFSHQQYGNAGSASRSQGSTSTVPFSYQQSTQPAQSNLTAAHTAHLDVYTDPHPGSTPPAPHAQREGLLSDGEMHPLPDGHHTAESIIDRPPDADVHSWTSSSDPITATSPRSVSSALTVPSGFHLQDLATMQGSTSVQSGHTTQPFGDELSPALATHHKQVDVLPATDMPVNDGDSQPHEKAVTLSAYASSAAPNLRTSHETTVPTLALSQSSPQAETLASSQTSYGPLVHQSVADESLADEGLWTAGTQPATMGSGEMQEAKEELLRAENRLMNAAESSDGAIDQGTLPTGFDDVKFPDRATSRNDYSTTFSARSNATEAYFSNPSYETQHVQPSQSWQDGQHTTADLQQPDIAGNYGLPYSYESQEVADSPADDQYGQSPVQAFHVQSQGYSSYPPPDDRTDPYRPHTPSRQDDFSSRQTKEVSHASEQTSAYNPYEFSARPPVNRAYTHSPDTYNVTGPSNSSSDTRSHRPPVPVISFGFNGRFVTCFPGSDAYGSGAFASPYDESRLRGDTGRVVKVQKLANLLTVDTACIEAFPGPLFMDSSASSATGKSKKKQQILSWLGERLDETEKESGFFGGDLRDQRKREALDRTVLLKIVRALLENDGKLSGSPKIVETLRNIFVPALASASTASSFTTAADLSRRAHSPEPNNPALAGAAPSATAKDLDTLQNLLLRGEKREAVRYAMDNKLWPHALVISAGVDQDLQASVTKEFIQAELSQMNTGDRQPLKVAYSLFTGSETNAISELLPKRRFDAGASSSSLGSYSYAPTASRTASPSPMAEVSGNIDSELLDQWQQTAAMVVANRRPGETQALTSLGDTLAVNGRVTAAHACYLVSPQTSQLGGPGISGVRYSLVGSPGPVSHPTSCRDVEAIFLSEIVEFALSLATVSKGQETYVGLPHLQAYKIVHALELADLGMHAKSQRYCDTIGATLKLATKASPFYHPSLLAQVKELSDRLSQVSFQDKSGSWISRKVPKPTLDNVWSTLEGRFSKFVAGEVEEDPAETAKRRAKEDAAKGVAGPFAHYSSITPTGQESISRSTSFADLRATPPPQPTSVPNTVTKSALPKSSGHHRRSSSYGFGPYGADPYPPYVNSMPQTSEESENAEEQNAEHQLPNQRYSYDAAANVPDYGYTTPQNDTGWWAAANTQEDSPWGTSGSSAPHGQTPMFSPVSEQYAVDNRTGLMSPMNFTSPPVMPAPSSAQGRLNTHSSQVTAPPSIEEEEDDELGLGNSSSRRRKDRTNESGDTSTQGNDSAQTGAGDTTPQPEPAKSQDSAKPAPASGWLGRIFRRETGSPVAGSGPIKAKLGDETSFVYDPVEKRWVNKKAGSASPSATPAPPPRAQTASPTAAARTASASTPPPAQSKSASTTPIPSTPATQVRSESTPPPPLSASGASAPPPPSRPGGVSVPSPTGQLPPPPTTRKASGVASKKPIRSRYVDVLGQQ